ncbi:hypothetical protein SARC_01260 [Sphaeroforma arctica JP610]|uniref:Uncharacterized protein n=1 Tax=Sphaeroforma arctica JP610 TaxID=667725 RepID=A0A0L0GCF6_9EUKA|nr:hypothetical protein SARC_01260 [Sphaeroforma arctica JP610]KNC86579.1 hypothetical protein SARC_01260 [Sphaeroforma arctica JP610]|eukprot:XP_014160481.1 hypothetical protein SARC_01260 [Sphaeroforma arctica JP610]
MKAPRTNWTPAQKAKTIVEGGYTTNINDSGDYLAAKHLVVATITIKLRLKLAPTFKQTHPCDESLCPCVSLRIKDILLRVKAQSYTSSLNLFIDGLSDADKQTQILSIYLMSCLKTKADINIDHMVDYIKRLHKSLVPALLNTSVLTLRVAHTIPAPANLPTMHGIVRLLTELTTNAKAPRDRRTMECHVCQQTTYMRLRSAPKPVDNVVRQQTLVANAQPLISTARVCRVIVDKKVGKFLPPEVVFARRQGTLKIVTSGAHCNIRSNKGDTKAYLPFLK